jgi:hypothetical protein
MPVAAKAMAETKTCGPMILILLRRLSSWMGLPRDVRPACAA